MTQKMKVVPYYNDVLEALDQAHCPLCRLLARGADRYIDAMLWAMVNDPASREVVRASRGFCHPHAWMFIRGGAALGVTIVMDSVIRKLMEVMAANPLDQAAPLQQLRRALRLPQAEGPTKLADDLGPQTPCPICTSLNPLEEGYASMLLENMLGPKPLLEPFRQSDGLCLPHLQYVLKIATPGEPLQALLDAQQSIWGRLQGELAEFIRKYDHRFAHEPIGAEGDAWQRALSTISGPAVDAFEQSGNIFHRR